MHKTDIRSSIQHKHRLRLKVSQAISDEAGPSSSNNPFSSIKRSILETSMDTEGFACQIQSRERPFLMASAVGLLTGCQCRFVERAKQEHYETIKPIVS